MSDEELTLNIPSLLTLAVVSFFVIRWFLKRDGSSEPEASARSRGRRGHAVDPAQVEQVAQMFPQLSTRDIMWDLQRNGGSVAATTERILTGQGLEPAPQSFQPQIAISLTNGAASHASAGSTFPPKSAAQDLISRYNLSSRIANDETPDANKTSPVSNGWSTSREERQKLLQKRRDEMILAARRRMEQRDREGVQSTPSL